jgi:Uma2 family endonuclease
MGEMILQGNVHRISVDEYDKMTEAGIFDLDERVELVEGFLISFAPPQGQEHAGMLWGCAERLRERLHDKAAFWGQMPLILCGDTVLEPDLALLVAANDRYRRKLPRPADVHAVIEVAVSSLISDRTRKLELYAASNIVEYWVLDVRNERIEMYRDPRGMEYASYRLALRGDSVSFAAFPDVVFSVDELLG